MSLCEQVSELRQALVKIINKYDREIERLNQELKAQDLAIDNLTQILEKQNA